MMEFTRKGKTYRIDGKKVDFLAAIDEAGIDSAYEYAEPGYTVPKNRVAALLPWSNLASILKYGKRRG